MIGGAVAIMSTGARFAVLSAGAPVRRALVLAGLVFAALPPGSALAHNITVGKTGTPLSNSALFGGREDVQTSAAVRAAGVVTRFHIRSSTCNLAKRTYDFQVLRPLGEVLREDRTRAEGLRRSSRASIRAGALTITYASPQSGACASGLSATKS
jgi:hypothetical protein